MDIKVWQKNLAVLWAAQFIGMSAVTGVISFLPLYVAHLGMDDAAGAAMWSGLLVGAAALCAAISNPFWGALADRRGRKPMVEKVMLLFGFIMIAMAYVHNVYELLALRLLQGLCGGFAAAATALAVSLAPPGRISFTLGTLQTSLIVGGAVGPLIGGIAADGFGYRIPFLVFGALCLLAFCVVRFSIREDFRPAAKNSRPPLAATFRFVLSLPELRLMLAVQFLLQFSIQCLGPILPLYIRTMVDGSASLASISGSIIAVAGVASAIGSGSIGVLGRNFSHKQILVTAGVLGSLSFGLQLAAGDIASLAVLRAINGLCIGAMLPSSNTIIACLIPPAKRGAAFGITSGAALLGNVAGPLSAGVLSLSFGLTAVFWLTAALFLLLSLVLLVGLKGSYDAEPNETPASS